MKSDIHGAVFAIRSSFRLIVSTVSLFALIRALIVTGTKGGQIVLMPQLQQFRVGLFS